MTIVIGLAAFVFMLSVIVLIHELGHFLAARKFGVYVHEFSIGMGPLIWQKQGKETRFSIRAIPFGGFVMMAGETDSSQEQEDDWLKEVPLERRLSSKKTWQQVIVMAAGVFMNIVLAAILYIGIALAQGYVVESPPVIYEVVEETPAAQAGLQAGDRIVSITNGSDTVDPESQYEVSVFVNMHPTESSFVIERDGELLTFQITPEYQEEDQMYLLGYTSKAQAVEVPWYRSILAGLENMADSGTLIFQSFGMLLKGQGYENLSGPIGILDVTTQTAQLGLLSYLSLFALISLNIGIFNLIPIPALDGGRILILLLERISGKKVSARIVENIIMASFVLLIGMFLYASYNDIMRMFF